MSRDSRVIIYICNMLFFKIFFSITLPIIIFLTELQTQKTQA